MAVGDLTTRAILEEFQEGVENDLFPETDITWIRQTDLRGRAEQLLFQRFRNRLDAGEASCLSIAIHRNHDLLTDDLDARRLARREGVRISGSVGVLISLVRRTAIEQEEGNRILRQFIDTGYFSPVETLDDLV